uniref:RRM domain-containing protein n=1 Tax=Macrostomum lignano TaxID=282301 RepID=A0A1I8J806_9PLAT
MSSEQEIAPAGNAAADGQHRPVAEDAQTIVEPANSVNNNSDASVGDADTSATIAAPAKLNGLATSGGIKKSQRVRVMGASGKHNDKDLAEMFGKYGDVAKIEPHNYQEGVLVVSMDCVDSANRAVAELNNVEFQGQKLILNNDSANQRRLNQQRRSAPPATSLPLRENYPLRILINSDLVGAIIGKGGETIKEITNKTKARVDVKREVVQKNAQPKKSSPRSPEKGDATEATALSERLQIVFVYGSPESCSDACREIMSICIGEAKEKGKEEPDLGILAEDRFCGRIIGKDGKNLNTIREKSKTSIQLSNSPTITTYDSSSPTFSLDRIITVKGSLEGMCQAEKFLSEKLRQCHTIDMQQYSYAPSVSQGYPAPYQPVEFGYPAPVPGMLPAPGAPLPGYSAPGFRLGMPANPTAATFAPLPSPSAAAAAQYGAAAMQAPTQPPPPPPQPLPAHHHQQQHHGGHLGMVGMMPMAPAGPAMFAPAPPPPQAAVEEIRLDEAVYMRIPHASAGAVIGSDGVSIKKIMEDTKTYVNVSKVNVDPKRDGELPQRLVTIRGPPGNQCRAQWQIFQRVRASVKQQETPDVSERDLRLWTVLRVPKKWIGRIIGKQGKTVRNLQATSGCIINLPDEPDMPEERDQSLEIYGNFDCTQLALTKIRALISQAQVLHQQQLAASLAYPMPAPAMHSYPPMPPVMPPRLAPYPAPRADYMPAHAAMPPMPSYQPPPPPRGPPPPRQQQQQQQPRTAAGPPAVANGHAGLPGSSGDAKQQASPPMKFDARQRQQKR